MTIVSNPVINVTKTPPQTTISNQDQRVLVIGQQIGALTSGVLVENIGNNVSDIDVFGTDSLLAHMLRGYKDVNSVTVVDAIPLNDNGSGVDAKKYQNTE